MLRLPSAVQVLLGNSMTPAELLKSQRKWSEPEGLASRSQLMRASSCRATPYTRCCPGRQNGASKIEKKKLKMSSKILQMKEQLIRIQDQKNFDMVAIGGLDDIHVTDIFV